MAAMTRSEIMSRIRGKGTGLERTAEAALAEAGLMAGAETHWGEFKADVAWPRERVALFLDGCFWHFCPEHGKVPKTNPEWWRAKLLRNRERDAEANEGLSGEGWTVLRAWSHSFGKGPSAPECLTASVRSTLAGGGAGEVRTIE
jgi:DNA mismatch endonuclease, patch repair protein